LLLPLIFINEPETTTVAPFLESLVASLLLSLQPLLLLFLTNSRIDALLFT
jgi:hypothetical protein